MSTQSESINELAAALSKAQAKISAAVQSIGVASITGDARQILTQSRLATARTCQRKHDLRYNQGFRAVQEEQVLFFGSLVHTALEAWWLSTGDRLRDARAALAVSECDQFTRAMAEAMMFGYDARWGEEQQHYEVIAVEQGFCADLRNPKTGALSRTWCLAGKIDVIVRDRRDGLVRIVEHKTSSESVEPGSAYWKRLRMDQQVSVYFVGATSLGHDVAACVYDVLAKPGQRPYKATPPESRKYKANGELYTNQRDRDETPEEYRERLLAAIGEDPTRYFARGEVVRLESEIEEALTDIWELGQQVREAKLAGRAPRNPGACMNYNRECEFFSVCSGEADINDTSKFLRSVDIHPELNVTKEESST